LELKPRLSVVFPSVEGATYTHDERERFFWSKFSMNSDHKHTDKFVVMFYPLLPTHYVHTCPERPWGPASLLYYGHRVFPGGKERPGRDADPSPPSSAVVMKE